MYKFTEFNQHSNRETILESQQLDASKVYNIEDVVFNRGIVGAKQSIRVLTELKDRLSGTLLVSREEILSISEKIMKASMLLKDIDSLTLNRISASNTLKNQFKEFTKTKRKHLLDSNITSVFLKFVEQSLNSNLLKAKKSDTKRRRQLEKTHILRFYRTTSKDIPLIFEFISMIIDIKNEISKKFKTVKDEDSQVKIEEGFISVQNPNNIIITLFDDEA
jgi:hypothetical protein